MFLIFIGEHLRHLWIKYFVFICALCGEMKIRERLHKSVLVSLPFAEYNGTKLFCTQSSA